MPVVYSRENKIKPMLNRLHCVSCGRLLRCVDISSHRQVYTFCPKCLSILGEDARDDGELSQDTSE